MELRQLKYFLAVADARSFVRGAAEQYISRQPISKAISQLEAELNVELFMRDSSGAFLTPAGVMFYERVRNAVLELEQLQAEMQQLGSRFRQTIRIGFSIGTLDLYEEPLRQFREQQSNLSVSHFECAPKVCAGLLTERQADVVITSAPPDNKQFYCQPILSAPLTVAVSEAVTDWKTLPLCCFDDGQTENLCRDAELSVQSSGIDLGRQTRPVTSSRILPTIKSSTFIGLVSQQGSASTEDTMTFRSCHICRGSTPILCPTHSHGSYSG